MSFLHGEMQEKTPLCTKVKVGELKIPQGGSRETALPQQAEYHWVPAKNQNKRMTERSGMGKEQRVEIKGDKKMDLKVKKLFWL